MASSPVGRSIRDWDEDWDEEQRPKKPGVLRSQFLVSAIASVRILYRSRPESQDPEIADRSAGTSGTHHRDGQIARRVRPGPGTAEPKVPERPG
jgi:hypothetical protein